MLDPTESGAFDRDQAGTRVGFQILERPQGNMRMQAMVLEAPGGALVWRERPDQEPDAGMPTEGFLARRPKERLDAS